LGEGHGQELIPTGEGLDLAVAAVSPDATSELVDGNKIDDLSEDGLANVHGPLLKNMGNGPKISYEGAEIDYDENGF
jgi:hypothetical protein